MMKIDLSLVTMPFGQYVGTKMKDLPIDYLSKLMDNDDPKRTQFVQAAIVAEWERRKNVRSQ
jgi:uncharacterized protein (DUF3820 family)